MLQAYLSLGFEVFLKNKLRTMAFLSDLQKKFGISLTNEQIRRINFYTIQSSLTNNWFSTLTGHKPGKEVLQNALHLGAITPIADSLMDDFGFHHTEIFEQLKTKDPSPSNHVRLAGHLYEQIIRSQDEVSARYFKEVVRLQDLSLKQLQKDKLSFEELYEISYAKGGYSTLLYRSVLGTPLISGEEEAIYHLGGILQLTNDMFDVYKDYKNGQQTLFTNSEDIGKLRSMYVELIEEMYARFLALKYPTKNIKQALSRIFIVLSRGMVCINQLVECQKRTDNIFRIDQYERTELICDMEKVLNIIKSIIICNSLRKLIERQ